MKWQVSWSKNSYDYKQLIRDYLEGHHTGFVTQSKGMAKMVVVPQIGNEVIISCDKKKILKCKVVSDFVIHENGANDEYCIGMPETRIHTRNNTFLMLQIIEVYENPEPLKGFQRTWVKLE